MQAGATAFLFLDSYIFRETNRQRAKIYYKPKVRFAWTMLKRD